MLTADAHAALDIARAAAAVILARYGRASLHVTDKLDGSPVTDADLAADALIRARLEARWPDEPVLSEETAPPTDAVRRAWRRWWSVDPLDGTKDFVAGTGEFCVSMGRIEDGRPILGVLVQPVTGVAWIGERGHGTHRVDPGGAAPLPLRDRAPAGELASFCSRFHPNARADALARALGATRFVEMGSALKLAHLAEGRADMAIGLGDAKLWDLAAGQIIAEEAGCRVLALVGGGPKRPPRHDGPTLYAGPYIACGPRLDVAALDRVEYARDEGDPHRPA